AECRRTEGLLSRGSQVRALPIDSVNGHTSVLPAARCTGTIFAVGAFERRRDTRLAIGFPYESHRDSRKRSERLSRACPPLVRANGGWAGATAGMNTRGMSTVKTHRTP